MLTKEEIRVKALEIGFADAGVAGVEPFTSQLDYIAVDDRYKWTEKLGFNLKNGIEPLNILDNGKSLIVLLYSYFNNSIPPSLEKHYGRCYLNDDRVTKDGLAVMVKGFRGFLRDNGINTKLGVSMPEKLSAMRAGVGTSGKNTLLFASKSAMKSSFIFPIVIVTDAELEPDTPSVSNGCPDWCRNACVAACPTKALFGNGKIDPSKCISYLTYFGKGVTPRELREPMGLYIYGCDRCQNVCPRNVNKITSEKDENPKFVKMEEDFAPEKILLMDQEYFEKRIQPFMFYMSYKSVWRWRMNAARAMGNSGNREYIRYLKQAYGENDDDRVKIMIAWALGKLGGDESGTALKDYLKSAEGDLKTEIEISLSEMK
ncbi:MAG TPA: 4Fe-4S double cluster binding domain-containing protein [Spirochaetota bacterium]|nr:4Fe-4S double cluster binding domain-containing protein [Spirochaetota bacterium]HPJ33640.1 4Fe-4S double cluster binding domain-containing protein [Spirochaetota bacterium]